MVSQPPPSGATRWWYWPWHTILLGAYPALFLFAENIADQLTLQPLWAPLLISIGAAAGVLILCWAFRRDWLRAGLMASAVLVVFFSFGHVWNLVSGIVPERWMLAGLWFGGAVALVVLAARGGRWVRPATTALNLALVALVVYNALLIGGFIVSTRAFGSIRGEMPEVTVGESGRPDVYYIVLDRYAGEATLREFYDYDNSPFLGALEDDGFVVAHDSWANYFKTALSMFSTLTMEHIEGDAWDDADPDTFGPIHRAFQERMSVPATFKELGYEYVHIGNWWEPTARQADADIVYRYTQQTEFGTTLLSTTLASAFLPESGPVEAMHGSPLQRAHVLLAWEALLEASRRSGPTFTLAHITLPHPPYAFNPDGSEPTSEERSARTEEEEYVAQLEYTNRKILELVDEIVATADPDEPEPVFILQTDEGPFPPRFALPNSDNFPWLEATDDEIAWKFRILTAYRLPGVDAAAQGFTDQTTPVNAFRIFFNAYFDSGLELLPDVVYLSPDTDHMFEFVEYDHAEVSQP